MVMGHEFMGIIEETGRAVTNLKKNDRVVGLFPIVTAVRVFFANTDCRAIVKIRTRSITGLKALF